jgi:membrane associated rhomboid family serine protease
MKIQYNSPVILTYALICALVMLLTHVFGDSVQSFFVLKAEFSFISFRDWLSLITYTLGHSSWNHLLGNMMLILLVGPMLEEKYSSKTLLIMMLLTALITAVSNIVLFNNNVLGASGIAFMMILLSSFSSFKKGNIPLTFVLVFVLYIGTEMVNAMGEDQISQFGHVAGGICGALFGFTLNKDAGKKHMISEQDHENDSL